MSISNNKKYKIIWEKWKDPFGSDFDEDYMDLLSETIEEEQEKEEIDEAKSLINSIKEVKSRIIITPFGAIPYNENTASGKIFNFWTGHTNFSITKNISDLIEDADGVETLDIFTRYRFRISVGKAFNDSHVMRSINQQVYSYLE